MNLMYPVQTKLTKISTMLFAVAALSACATVPDVSSEASEEAVQAPSAPVFVLKEIENRSLSEIEAVLGAPDLTRVEGEGAFHRYDLAACGVVIVFYPDSQGSRFAQHIEAVSSVAGEEAPDLDACLAAGR